MHVFSKVGYLRVRLRLADEGVQDRYAMLFWFQILTRLLPSSGSGMIGVLRRTHKGKEGPPLPAGAAQPEDAGEGEHTLDRKSVV